MLSKTSNVLSISSSLTASSPTARLESKVTPVPPHSSPFTPNNSKHLKRASTNPSPQHRRDSAPSTQRRSTSIKTLYQQPIPKHHPLHHLISSHPNSTQPYSQNPCNHNPPTKSPILQPPSLSFSLYLSISLFPSPSLSLPHSSTMHTIKQSSSHPSHTPITTNKNNSSSSSNPLLDDIRVNVNNFELRAEGDITDERVRCMFNRVGSGEGLGVDG